ncbi:MAG: carboxypeptidase regulatory-like domain-containing protein [Planctomycetia bacterium]|nr:carboxypeptidase regulatory-like domain-containing protein [Planctomycetia bacterium]
MRRFAPLLALLLLGGAAFLLLRPRDDAAVVGDAVDDAGPAATRAPGAVTPNLASGPGRRPAAMGGGTGGADELPADASASAEGPRVVGVVLDDATGEPVKGAVVVVTSASKPCPSTVPAEVFEWGYAVATPVRDGDRSAPRERGKVSTGEDGAFALPWDTGPADLVVRKAGWLVATACAVAADAPVTVRLRKGATIAGVVVTPTGAPIAGVEVTARPPRGLPETPGRVEAATSDAEGRFAVEGLLPEAFDLLFRHAAYFDEAKAEVAAGTRALRVVMRPAFVVTFRLTTDDRTRPESPTVEWRLAGGGPGEIAMLRPEPAPAPAPGTAALPPEMQADAPPAGTFVYEPLKVPAGRPTATFVVKAIGFEPWTSEPVEVPPEGGATTLDVPLRRDPTLGRARIALEDREHRPLSFVGEQCTVSLGRRDGKPVPAGVVMLPREAVEFPALVGGPWRFVVRCPRFAPATVDLDVRAAGDTEGLAVLSPAARLKVRFFATEPLLVKFRLVAGDEIARPFVEKPAGAAGADGPPEEAGEEQTTAAGQEGLVLTGLAAGRYTIEGIGPEVAVPPTPVDLVEGETKDVEITVTRR